MSETTRKSFRVDTESHDDFMSSSRFREEAPLQNKKNDDANNNSNKELLSSMVQPCQVPWTGHTRPIPDVFQKAEGEKPETTWFLFLVLHSAFPH